MKQYLDKKRFQVIGIIIVPTVAILIGIVFLYNDSERRLKQIVDLANKYSPDTIPNASLEYARAFAGSKPDPKHIPILLELLASDELNISELYITNNLLRLFSLSASQREKRDNAIIHSKALHNWNKVSLLSGNNRNQSFVIKQISGGSCKTVGPSLKWCLRYCQRDAAGEINSISVQSMKCKSKYAVKKLKELQERFF